MQWLADPDWLLIEFELPKESQSAPDPATQITVQELLQEREITYRNFLAAYLKLQEVNRQKTVFLASAAHELKTPLAVIKGYYDLLLTGSLGRLSEKQRDILEESKESCERLVRLVSMFLNYSALESGKLVLHFAKTIFAIVSMNSPSAGTKHFSAKGAARRHIRPSIPNFRFDYQKVQQAAANLLDNALKHTPAGGSVTLRAAPHFWERRVSEAMPQQERRRFRLPRPNSVEVSVKDTGPGITAEHHQEIFEDFVRVDRNTTGMGLGLAIAKRLVQAHRGKIWVESELPTAADSRFCCRWTNKRFRCIQLTSADLREREMAVKEKILVVDDEPSIRKYLQTLLEVDGFDVETVGSGKRRWPRSATAIAPISSSSTC